MNSDEGKLPDYQYWLRSLENDARPSRLRVNDDHGELGLLHLYICDSTHGDPELTYRIAIRTNIFPHLGRLRTQVPRPTMDNRYTEEKSTRRKIEPNSHKLDR